MTQPPRRNLPPDSEQWGRWVEQMVTDNDRAQLAASQATTNALSAINGSLQLISGQIAQLQTGPARIDSYFTQVGPQSAQPSPIIGATRFFPRPSWATKASGFVTNEAYFQGDPVVFFAQSTAEVLPDSITATSGLLDAAIVQIDGQVTRRASATKTFSFSAADLAGADRLKLTVAVSRDALPSGKSVAYVTSGLVFWNA